MCGETKLNTLCNSNLLKINGILIMKSDINVPKNVKCHQGVLVDCYNSAICWYCGSYNVNRWMLHPFNYNCVTNPTQATLIQ